MATNHKDIVLANTHSIVFRTYADEAARLADGALLAEDVDKVVKQLSNDTYYIVRTESPTPTFIEISGSGGGAAGVWVDKGSFIHPIQSVDNVIIGGTTEATAAINLNADGTAFFDGNVTIGAGAPGVDYTLTFDGEDNDGILTFHEDEDCFSIIGSCFNFTRSAFAPISGFRVQISDGLSGVGQSGGVGLLIDSDATLFTSQMLTIATAGAGNIMSVRATGEVIFNGTSGALLMGGVTSATADIILNRDGSAVFNEQGNSVNFRVEGLTDTDLLLVDAATDTVQLGKLNINGAYTFPTADGTAGQTLRTNGAGIVSFATALTAENYINSLDTTTQTIVTPGTFQTITFNTNSEINGWTHATGTDAFTVPVTGFYIISRFVQMTKTSGASSLFEFRATVNGTPVGTVVSESLITNNDIKAVSVSAIVSLSATDVVRFEWTAGANTQVVATSTVGSTKSASITISRIA